MPPPPPKKPSSNLIYLEAKEDEGLDHIFQTSTGVWSEYVTYSRRHPCFTAGLQNNLSSNTGQSASPFHAVLYTRAKRNAGVGMEGVEGVTH